MNFDRSISPFMLLGKVELILGEQQIEYLKQKELISFIVLFKCKLKVELILGKYLQFIVEHTVLLRYKYFFVLAYHLIYSFRHINLLLFRHEVE